MIDEKDYTAGTKTWVKENQMCDGENDPVSQLPKRTL